MRDILRTGVYSARVRRNGFIEALHVLHETLATNNCFSANACWYFLISETYRPVDDASDYTHISGHFIYRGPTRRGNASTKRRLRGGTGQRSTAIHQLLTDFYWYIQCLLIIFWILTICGYCKYFHNDFHPVIYICCARYRPSGGHALCTFRLLIDWLTRGRVNFHSGAPSIEASYRRALCARFNSPRRLWKRITSSASAPYSHSAVKSIQSKIKRVRRTVKI